VSNLRESVNGERENKGMEQGRETEGRREGDNGGREKVGGREKEGGRERMEEGQGVEQRLHGTEGERCEMILESIGRKRDGRKGKNVRLSDRSN
jgi:hypothetical protein